MKDYLIETVERLVSFDTVSQNGNGQAADQLADELDRHGFAVKLHETGEADRRQTNVVAWAGPEEPDGLILSGHIDTVPFAEQPGWTTDPLKLTAQGDRLIGRGTTDMKGFIAQCLAATRELRVAELRRPVVLLLTCEEEVGCLGASRLAEDLPGLLPDLPLPRCAWIGEPTSYRVFHAHKGVVDFEIRIGGRGGHSSLPQLGCNAIAVAGEVLREIGALQQELRSRPAGASGELFPDAPYNTWNVGVIHGGSASNMIADECRIRLSYRPLPDEDPEAAYRELVSRLAQLDAKDFAGGEERARIEVGRPLVVAGLDTPVGSPLERALGAADAGRAGAPYCTDGGAFARAGIDSLICGPGELDQAHQPDESIARDALGRGPELIAAVIRELCVA
jgi:acetylornithine deacetylase